MSHRTPARFLSAPGIERLRLNGGFDASRLLQREHNERAVELHLRHQESRIGAKLLLE
jgi:hypothetical protein